MAIFHLVFHAPHGQGAPAWFERIQPGDAVLFLGDALHGIRDQGPWHVFITRAQGTAFHALEDDVLRCGISLPAAIRPLHDAGFVELAAAHEASVTWS